MNVPSSLLGGFVFLKLRSINLNASAAVATVVLGGLLSTLVLTLLALPSLYYVAPRPDSRRAA